MDVRIIDNFYDDPYAIRRKASQLSFVRREGALYPGMAANSGDDWEDERNKLRKYIDDECDSPCPKSPAFEQGKFRLALAEDEFKRLDLVHQDLQKWSGVVYLTLPEHCKGGVAFYKHKKTGATFSNLDWEKNVFGKKLEPSDLVSEKVLEHMSTSVNWEKIEEVEMKFNRAVIIMGHCFHGSTGVFGTSIENGRLTQHFEYYSLYDWIRTVKN